MPVYSLIDGDIRMIEPYFSIKPNFQYIKSFSRILVLKQWKGTCEKNIYIHFSTNMIEGRHAPNCQPTFQISYISMKSYVMFRILLRRDVLKNKIRDLWVEDW